jgi:hypothetical protein
MLMRRDASPDNWQRLGSYLRGLQSYQRPGQNASPQGIWDAWLAVLVNPANTSTAEATLRDMSFAI